MNKYAYIVTVILLIACNIYILSSYRGLQTSYKKLYSKSEQLKYSNDIQEYTFKEVLKNNFSKKTEKTEKYEIGIRLNKSACFTCNEYAVSLVKNNFSSKSICFILYNKDSALVDMLSLNKNKIIYSDSLFKLKSIDPVLFLKEDSNYSLTFSPNKDMPNLVKNYIDGIKKIIN